MSEQEERIREEESGYARPKQPEKKGGWTAVTVILAILALPVILPVALAVAGTVFLVLLALFGCGAAILLGVAGCAAAALVSLVAGLVCGVVGLGFGFVTMFSSPASGAALIGTCLMVLGACLLGCLLVYGCIRLLWKALLWFWGWWGRMIENRKGRVDA